MTPAALPLTRQGGLSSHLKSRAATTMMGRHDVSKDVPERQNRREILANGLGVALSMGSVPLSPAFAEEEPKMRRLSPIQFIAALGDPDASSGTGAEKWGLWRDDPGPMGVFLKNYKRDLEQRDFIAPAKWKFDKSSWWVEEHGLIMPTPAPLPLKMDTVPTSEKKRYVVTGGRKTQSILTVYRDGRWALSEGSLYDVTHLPCRSAVYTGADGGMCTPVKEMQQSFPVEPGAKMPKFDGCNTQDWAVLFVLGEEAA